MVKLAKVMNVKIKTHDKTGQKRYAFNLKMLELPRNKNANKTDSERPFSRIEKICV